MAFKPSQRPVRRKAGRRLREPGNFLDLERLGGPGMPPRWKKGDSFTGKINTHNSDAQLLEHGADSSFFLALGESED